MDGIVVSVPKVSVVHRTTIALRSRLKGRVPLAIMSLACSSTRRAFRQLSRRTFSTTSRVAADHVRIIEVGPRDGLQNEKTSIPAETKIELVHRLAKTGLKTIEAGSFVAPKWVPQVRKVHTMDGGQMLMKDADGSLRPGSLLNTRETPFRPRAHNIPMAPPELKRPGQLLQSHEHLPLSTRRLPHTTALTLPITE